MKKLVSILLAVVMLLSFMSVTAFATEKTYGEIPNKTDLMYLERFKEYNELYEDDYYYCYREFCYYSDENNEEPDWVLIDCSILPEPWECRHGALVGNRVLYTSAGPGLTKSETGLLVYIPKTDTFIDLVNSNIDEVVGACTDFIKVIEENNFGQVLGDVNDDYSLDILDATHMQFVLARMSDYSVWGVFTRLGNDNFSMGDFDKDGEFTVMDATAIQKKLAHIEEETQLNEELVLVPYEKPLYMASYPEKPDGCVELDYQISRNKLDYWYSPDHLGIYDDRFLAVIKSKEQYEYVFDGCFDYGFDDEFFEKYWVLASYVREGNERKAWIIDEVSLLDDTLYVYVALYESIGDTPVNPAIPPYMSLVAIEKEKLADVTNIVRVDG